MDTSVTDLPPGAPGLEAAGNFPKTSRGRKATSLFEPVIVRRAVGEAFVKLNPRTEARNPIMFVECSSGRRRRLCCSSSI